MQEHPMDFAFSLALTAEKSNNFTHYTQVLLFFRFFNGAPAQYTSYRACSKDWARYEDHVYV